MTDKFSIEKEDQLKALGAEVIRTDNKLKYTDPNSDFGIAHRLVEQIPNSIYIGQFQNLSNPLVHYDMIAEELLYQCDGKIDMFVAGSGTGGTLTGVGRKLKETISSVKDDPLDKWIKVSDEDGFNMARRLIKEEGILCGGSSGLIFWGALQAAKDLGKDQRCVAVLPDGMKYYMSKFLSDDWMKEKGWLK